MLQAYISILYLHLPRYFKILLRGKVVEPHSLVDDLNFIECIKYNPTFDGSKEVHFYMFRGVFLTFLIFIYCILTKLVRSGMVFNNLSINP